MGRRPKAQTTQTPETGVTALTTGPLREAAEPYLRLLRERRPHEKFRVDQAEAMFAVLSMCDGNVLRASELSGVSVSTIWDLKQRFLTEFETVRQEWKRDHAIRTQDAANVMMERIIDKAANEDVSLRDLSVAWGITVQRGAELAGDSVTTIRHEVVDTRALAPIADRLRSIRPMTDVIDITPEGQDETV